MSRDRRKIEERLLRFIREVLVDDESQPERDPLAADAVDSLGLEQLAGFIEQEFGVTVGGEEIVSRNFASVTVLTGFIERKLALGKR